MICDKCGKNNQAGAKKCVSCKAEMPPTSSCGGFSDILSFSAPLESRGANARGMMSGNTEGGIDRMEFEKLQKKYTNLAQTSRKTALVAFGAAAIGIIALVLSVSFWLGTKGTVKVLEEKIEKIENSAPVEVTNDFESSVQQIAKQIQEVTTDFESKAQQAAKQIQEKLKK